MRLAGAEHVERIGLPGQLSDVGVDDEDLAAVVRMSGGNPSIKANPRPVTETDVEEILSAAF